MGGIIDPKAVKEIEDFEKKCVASAERINEAFKGIASNGGAPASTAQLTAVVEATKKLTKAQQDLSAAQQKVTDKTMQQRVDAQLKAQQDRQAAIAASENATALQKLRAEMELLVNAQQKLVTAGQTTSAQYIENAKTLSRLSSEYTQLEQASGKLQVKQTTAYASTFQLTQVMRELPNFAISARVGFMSLSNNLPMLAESFTRLSKQIDEVTGKQYGWKGALKAFGSSLLGFNTIMIVASTLLVMYGDDLMKWIGKAFAAEKATDKLTTSQKALYKVLEGGAGTAKTAIEDVQRLGATIQKYGDNSQYAKLIIDDFNKTFNTHLTTIEQVKAEYPKLAAALIDNAIRMQAAMSLIGEASEQLLRQQRGEMVLSRFSDPQVATAEKNAKRMFALYREWNKEQGVMEEDLTKMNNELFGEIGKGDFVSSSMTPFSFSTKFSQAIAALETSGSKPELLKIMKDFGTEAGQQMLTAIVNVKGSTVQQAQLKKSIQELLPPPTDPKASTGGTVQTAQSIFIATEFYDKKRAELIRLMSDIELRTHKTTTNGVIISFNEREKAAQWYFDMLKALADSDNRTANNNAINRFEKDTKEIEQKRKKNKALFDAGKISQDELNKSETEYSAAQLAIKKNFETDFIQAEDKFNSTIQEGALKLNKTLFEISQDRYRDEVELLKISNDEKMRLIDENYTKQQAKTASKSTGEIVLSAITGYTKDNTQQALQDQKEYEQARINQEIQSLQEEYDLADTSGARKLEITRKWDELSKKNLSVLRQYDIDSTEAAERKKENLQIEIARKTIDALSSLWDNFYTLYFKKLDKQLEKDKKINAERLQDVADKEKAGVLTSRQAEEEKARINAFAQSQEDEINRKKEEAEKAKFLGQQAIALAQIWINFAQAAASFENMLAAGAFTPLYLGLALTSTALVAAQTIPAFATGGTMEKEGLAVLGDGGKNELFMSPSGKWGVSPAVPTLFNLEKGTKILPDVNKIDLTGMLALANVRPYDNGADRLEKQLLGLRSDIQKQRPAQLKGMRLIQQMQQAEHMNKRNKSLMK